MYIKTAYGLEGLWNKIGRFSSQYFWDAKSCFAHPQFLDNYGCIYLAQEPAYPCTAEEKTQLLWLKTHKESLDGIIPKWRNTTKCRLGQIGKKKLTNEKLSAYTTQYSVLKQSFGHILVNAKIHLYFYLSHLNRHSIFLIFVSYRRSLRGKMYLRKII